MKHVVTGLVLAAALLVAGQAQAQAGFGGMGAWWMDGDEALQVGGGVCATCLGGQGVGAQGAGAQGTGTGLGLGLGFGDGTLPQPQDGTGFGSPWGR